MKFFKRIANDPKSWLKDAFPICKWLPKYKAADIPYDVVAGITVGLTLLPVSLAYAQMAYLRPEYGLYSSFIGTIVYIFLGTSKDAIIGPSAIGSMLMGQFNVLNPLFMDGDNTYASLLAFVNGIILLVVGVFKLGFIVNLFSIPVVSGFTSAAAFAITASQLKTLVGIRKGPNDSPGVFVKQIKNIYDRRSEIRLLDVTFGLVSLGFLLLVEYGHELLVKYAINRCRPPSSIKAKKVRDVGVDVLRLVVAARSIMVFIPTTAIAYWLHSRDPAGTESKLTLVGYIKPGFPEFRFPRWQVVNRTEVFVTDNSSADYGQWVERDVVVQSTQEIMQALSVGIIIIPLMSIMEMFAILKALGRKNGYRIDATQELVALGISSFLQSFIQGYPISAATAKTALNDRCRVRSQLSTIFSVIIILVSIGCLTDVFFYVPKASLSAILIAAAHHLFDYHAVISIWREYKPDLALFILTFVLCLFYDLAFGIVIAILINMVIFLRPIIAMQLSVSREPLDLVVSGATTEHSKVTIIQLSHGMKYPSVDKFIDKMTHLLHSNDVHFVLDCRFVSGFDFTGIQAWRMLLRMAFQNKKHLIFTHLSEAVRAQLEELGLEDFRHVGDVETAIAEFSTKVGEVNKAAENNANVEEANMRRLRQTFSWVSTFSQHFAGHGLDQGHGHGGSKPDLAKGHHGNGRQIVAVEQVNVLREEDRLQQENRLMSLISMNSTPNFYNDIPIAIGNYQDDDPVEEGVETEEVLKEFPSYPVVFSVHGGLDLQLSRTTSETVIVDNNEGATIRRRHNMAKLREKTDSNAESNSVAVQTDYNSLQ